VAADGGNLAIALLHYPVYNKRREVVTTALTNLDLHDIARSSRTFGLERFYIVTPSAEQRNLAERITGPPRGAKHRPDLHRPGIGGQRPSGHICQTG